MPVPVDVDFSTLFSTSHLYIPEFQRGFSWEKHQLEDLWIDIQQIPDGKQHYCGSILTVKRGDIRTTLPSPSVVEQLVLVDGQQRCTTIFLLLLSIRDRLVQIGSEELADNINSNFIYFTEYGGRQHLRLKNEHDDLNNFMKQVVTGSDPNPTVAPEKRLVEAKRYFDSKIADFEEEELDDLRYKITSQLKSTQVYLDGSLDQPTVFEAINNRGLILSSMDKLKNYALLLISRVNELENSDINFEKKWFKSLEYLMKHNMYSRDKEDMLLSYYWQMKEGVVPTNGFDSFQEKFGLLVRDAALDEEKRKHLIQEFEKYSEGFVKFTECFTEIESRSNTYNKWGNSAEENISRKKASEWHKKQDSIGHSKLLLAIVVSSYMKFSNQEYVKILEALEKTLFRVYRIVDKSSNHGYGKIPKIASEIYSGSKTADDVVKWCIEFSKEEGTIEHMGVILKTRINSYNWRGIKYFLHEYERELGGGVVTALSEFPKKEQSIEHVLPQSSGEGNYWDELIEKFDEAGKPFMRERFTFEEKTKLLHNLGNLCLTQDNSYYSNHDYPRKRNGVDDEDQRCYKRATTHQEKKIAAGYEDWNPECILQREKDLIDFAMSRWKFDGED